MTVVFRLKCLVCLHTAEEVRRKRPIDHWMLPSSGAERVFQISNYRILAVSRTIHLSESVRLDS